MSLAGKQSLEGHEVAVDLDVLQWLRERKVLLVDICKEDLPGDAVPDLRRSFAVPGSLVVRGTSWLRTCLRPSGGSVVPSREPLAD